MARPMGSRKVGIEFECISLPESGCRGSKQHGFAYERKSLKAHDASGFLLCARFFAVWLRSPDVLYARTREP